MPIILAVGLFCYDKFEETPNKKMVNMSKLTKPYFRILTSILVQDTLVLHMVIGHVDPPLLLDTLLWHPMVPPT